MDGIVFRIGLVQPDILDDYLYTTDMNTIFEGTSIGIIFPTNLT